MHPDFQNYDPKLLQTIFSVLLIVQLVFGLVVWFLLYDSAAFFFDYTKILHIATPTTALVLNSLGNLVYKNGFEKTTEDDTIFDRIMKLQRAQISRWTLTEAGTFILFVVAVILENNLFLILGGINILYFLTLRPKIISFNSDAA
jgi:hypothetical protein